MIMQIFENDYIFWFFVLPFFPEKAQNKKNKVGIKNDFFINDDNARSKMPYTSSLSSRAERKDFFEKQ
jgi:hypothetical protein